jgi:diguanylate cyclase (GGDEF)-like protein
MDLTGHGLRDPESGDECVTLASVATPARAVAADMLSRDLEALFAADEALNSVVIMDAAGPVGALTRWKFFWLMSGRLGYGRALWARRQVVSLPGVSRLVLPGDCDLARASAAALSRASEQRYDDVVVTLPGNALGTLTVARLLAEMAHAHRHQALHDGLTGLANRSQFSARLKDALSPRAVLYVDVDDFKVVNDSYGHGTGDELLAAVAHRLASSVRPTDLVARIGGDEFAVLLEQIAAEEPAHVADRVVTAFQTPIAAGGRQLDIAVSVGVAVDLVGGSPDELMRRADVAMYSAKRSGKDGYSVFEPSARATPAARRELKADLLGGLDRGEFHLVYQPVVRLEDETPVAAEALIRWRHPEHGELPPAAFIPVAEQSGLIVQLGRWLLGEACRAGAAFQEARGGEPLSVSVNISPAQLRGLGLLADVNHALAESGLEPRHLCLELTETAVMRDPELAATVLGALSARGVRIAVDDFGTGFSALSQLQRLPIDVVKVDKCFVDPLRDADGDALTRGLLDLLDALGLRAVAEGVEHGSQRDALRRMPCELGQGFLFSRPVPADELIARLARGRRVGATA